MTDQWQRFTEVRVTRETVEGLAAYCDEFLVHGVDVEGKRLGMEAALVERLGAWSPLPVTYAGGAKTLEDLELGKALGQGRVDLTIGSGLDIFGGEGSYREVIAWRRGQEQEAWERVARRGRAR
jgi:phosphoribosylformimino-5-aminoimidazole carboxamide ribotide isomerase